MKRVAAVLLIAAGLPLAAQSPPPLVIEDFEAYPGGSLPLNWRSLQEGELVPLRPEHMADDEYFAVRRECGRAFVRAHTAAQAIKIILPNGEHFDWDLRQRPRLRWQWRAHVLPPGAREDQKQRNDAGAALYVTFGRDWLRRLRAIKYTYSSTLPVGATAAYGALKVLVASSAADSTGGWLTVERDVRADYRRLFRRDPPDRPTAILLWSDSDTLQDSARVDFDDIALLPAAD